MYFSQASSSTSNNQHPQRLPPISSMDEYLPSRLWQHKSPNIIPSSLPTPPQPEQWKSPPYNSSNELNRDSSFKPLFNTHSEHTYHQHQHQQHQHQQHQHNNNKVDNDMEEVVSQCSTLCNKMIDHKHNKDISSVQLDDMIGRANQVLNALLRLRKHQIASEQQRQEQKSTMTVAADVWRSTANDAALRQRKRGKRPAFQGRCHSCNISETPEWRRGPDGARTLCNACGLHYAKLSRKQQENRGMSQMHLLSRYSSGKLTPPADEIIIDRSPCG